VTAVEPNDSLQGTSVRPRKSPYQGLVPYSEDDSDYFFGRTVWRDVITDHLLAYRLTLLYGPSGVGKSSLLRAGVVHELRKVAAANLHLTGRPEILPAIVSQWSGDPIAAIQESLDLAGKRLWPTPPFAAPRGSLIEISSGWAERVDGRVLLVLDQFDEYFMYHETRPDGLALVDELTEVIADRAIPINLLISIREDALAKLDRFEGADVGLWENMLRIDHLDAEDAREAIEKPVERWNEVEAADGERITLEQNLVDAVIAEANARTVSIGSVGRGSLDLDESEAGGTRVEAPYLQLVMTRLWEEERRRGSTVLRVDTLNRMGGAQQIVRTHFDAVMRELPRRQRSRAAKVLQYLVTPAGTKIALPPSALAKWSNQKERRVVPILTTLSGGEQRILRTVSSPGDTSGATSYEIFHDRLADGILDWRRRYVRRRRLLRATAVLLGVLLAAGLAAARVIYNQHRSNAALEAEVAHYRIQRQQDLHTFRSRQKRLTTTAARSPFYARMVGPRGDAWFESDSSGSSADFSPDGREVAFPGPDGGVVVASPATGRRLYALHVGGGAGLVAYSPAGDAIGVEQSAARGGVWDRRSHHLRFRVTTDSSFNSLRFTRDGRQLVGAWHKGVAELWDVSKGKAARFGPLDRKTFFETAVSPDGSLIASAQGRRVGVWDVHSRKLLRTLEPGRSPTGVQFSPDSTSLLTVSPGRALLWDPRTGRRKTLQGAPPGITTPENGGVFLNLNRFWDFADGKVVIAGTKDLGIWSMRGKRLATIHDRHPTTIARFSPDGSIEVTGTDDGAIRAWSARGRLLAVLLPPGKGDDVEWLAFRPDGRLLVSGHDEGAVLAWKIAPDLAVTGTRVTATPGVVTVNARVVNLGLRKSATARLHVQGPDGLSAAVPVPSLAPGARRGVKLVLKRPREASGAIRVRVVPDVPSTDVRPENNEATQKIPPPK
jgi:WD40 repeat protein